MKTSGKNKKKLADIEGNVDISAVNFTKTNVYYVKRNDDGTKGIYKIGFKKNEETKLIDIEGFITKINVNNNYIYYPDLNEDGEIQMCRVKLNGEMNKEVL